MRVKMRTFEYDLSDKDLIRAFRDAYMKSRSPFGGQVYDPIGSYQAQEWAHTAQYLEGVLHARLAREKPPVRPGAMVQHRKKPQFFTYELRGDLVPTFIVEKVIYVGHDSFAASKKEKWHVVLKGNGSNPDQTVAFNNFEIVASDPTTAAPQPA